MDRTLTGHMGIYCSTVRSLVLIAATTNDRPESSKVSMTRAVKHADALMLSQTLIHVAQHFRH